MCCKVPVEQANADQDWVDTVLGHFSSMSQKLAEQSQQLRHVSEQNCLLQESHIVKWYMSQHAQHQAARRADQQKLADTQQQLSMMMQEHASQLQERKLQLLHCQVRPHAQPAYLRSTCSASKIKNHLAQSAPCEIADSDKHRCKLCHACQCGL